MLFVSISCKKTAEPIEYGKAQCGYCSMNIVDKTHAAQYVTKKGKQFKFDSIECMLHDLSKKNENEIEVLLVADYENPGEMIDAKIATFILCDAIKSPMGANISAVGTVERAKEILQKHEGLIETWETIKGSLLNK